MAAPILRRRRILAAKIETTVGTAQTLAAADADYNIFDAQINPNIDYDVREGQGGFSHLYRVQSTGDAGQVTFFTELHTDGSGGVPEWADVFLPACGLVKTVTTYAPQSQAPDASGSATKTITIGIYQDGLFKRLRGCMGNVVFNMTSGARVRCEFTFTGIWDDPQDIALIAPTYPTTTPLRFVSSSLTWGGAAMPPLANLSIDMGNQVELREDSTKAAAYISALIVGRNPTATLDPEANLVADYDTYGAKWLNDTLTALEALNVDLGSANNQVIFNAPHAQAINVQEGNRNDKQMDTITLQLNRSASAGDDELTIEFT